MMCHKAETAKIGCKVLPVFDVAKTNSRSSESSYGSEKEFGSKSDQKKVLSRVKELLQRAASAAARSPSRKWKVFQSRRKHEQKDQLDDSSSTSSKISTSTWDASRWSATSSVHSPLSLACTNDQMWVKNLSRLSITSQSARSELNILSSLEREECVRNGQWITTDADFVVLEL